MTSRIRTLVQKSQRAFLQGKPFLWRHLRNCVNWEIRHAKKTVTASSKAWIDPARPRERYSTIKRISDMHYQGNRVSIADCEKYSDQEQATHINNYFSTICSSLPALDTMSLLACLPAASGPLSVTLSQVWRRLASIQAHKTPGPDNSPSRILKIFAFELSEPVSNITNCSLREGVVSSQWREVTLVPLPKIIHSIGW